MDKNKPRIIVEVEPDGSVQVFSNLQNVLAIRDTLEVAKEALVANALKNSKLGEADTKIVPATAIPPFPKIH